MNAVLDQNLAVVDQAMSLLDSVGAEHFATGEDPIGPHIRHCIDFYRCFLDGIDVHCVDYDARQRSSDIETDIEQATAAFREIHARLDAIAEGEIERLIEVRADAAGAPNSWSRSTVRRELQFLLSHTVHHFALIALLLRQRGVSLPADFGYAPSTLEHAAQQNR